MTEFINFGLPDLVTFSPVIFVVDIFFIYPLLLFLSLLFPPFQIIIASFQETSLLEYSQFFLSFCIFLAPSFYLSLVNVKLDIRRTWSMLLCSPKGIIGANECSFANSFTCFFLFLFVSFFYVNSIGFRSVLQLLLVLYTLFLTLQASHLPRRS